MMEIYFGIKVLGFALSALWVIIFLGLLVYSDIKSLKKSKRK